MAGRQFEFGHALHRPVLSPCANYLAVISVDQLILVVNLSETANGTRSITSIKVPRSVQPFLKHCTILRWSPEVQVVDAHGSQSPSEVSADLTWLLLSDGKRLVALSTKLWLPNANGDTTADNGGQSSLMADYSLGEQFGKLTMAEFVFDHRRVVAFFEFGAHASIISMGKPQRDDIPNVKFSDSRGFAQSPQRSAFAVLQRERGQDRICVLELRDDDSVGSHAFDTHTSDAQAISWCPGSDPILAAVESQTYGTRVLFFTALGHPLKALELSASHVSLTAQPLGIEALGITAFKWTRAAEGSRTLQTVTDGQRHVLMRHLHDKSTATETLAHFTHPTVVDGAQSLVWQESDAPIVANASLSSAAAVARFLPISTAIDPLAGISSPDTSVDLHPNTDHTLLATRLRSLPKALFIFSLPTHSATPDVVLFFSHPIRQVLWHPTLPGALFVLVARPAPTLYAWHDPSSPPVSGTIPLPASPSPTPSTASFRIEARFVRPGVQTAHAAATPLLVTTPTSYDILVSRELSGSIAFRSLLRRDVREMLDDSVLDDDDFDASVIDTPSRAGRGSGKVMGAETRHNADIDTAGPPWW